ncbi:hypothetical protein NDU88_005165 [Pleurodeles waltl]|uniref:Uncharacterized protein n=1 Tax=Pleurodeles waltl TaxID=8319 RepID=A0AAV7T9X3_PLEWA|nr:hypothetical protein NDU88_005165 [Pleurodeles waltl]
MVKRFNHGIKGAIQMAIGSNGDWVAHPRKTEWSYRITTNLIAMTRGRNPSAKYNPACLFHSCLEQWSVESAREKDKNSQEKSELYYDLTEGTKTVEIKIGDWARIKKPGCVVKGESKYYVPDEVVEVLTNSIKLSNGKICNLYKVALQFSEACKDMRNGFQISIQDPLVDIPECKGNYGIVPDSMDSDLIQSSTTEVIIEENIVRKPDYPEEILCGKDGDETYTKRIRKPPRWLEDYVHENL